ncbi:hypothetical protein MFIFM68171_00344 [Madurella fahalii]|uniref:Ankyrin n=1 Tax=Madurella fahalii TaxID=1157608 RepID=A0ABQ0FXD5_9PEZI
MLIERGHDITIKDADGDDALSMAAKKGYADVVSLLLASDKVDVERKDKWGRTALSYAAENEHPNVVRVLIESGRADPDSKSDCGRTPLSYVAGKARWLTEPGVELFIASSKVNPDSKDKNGRTPVSYAAGRDHIPAAKLLISSGRVDLNSKDNEGRTPLSHASHYFAEFVLGFDGVETESKDNAGRTALSHAAGDGYKDLVMKLLNHGADPDSKDDMGKTPFMWAKKCSEAFKKGLFSPTVDGIFWEGPEYRGVLELLYPTNYIRPGGYFVATELWPGSPPCLDSPDYSEEAQQQENATTAANPVGLRNGSATKKRRAEPAEEGRPRRPPGLRLREV